MNAAHQDPDELARRPLAARHVAASTLARLDVALDAVVMILTRLAEEIVLGKRDLSTRARAHNALTRLFLQLSGRPERLVAVDQAAAIMPAKPSPSPDEVRRWIAAWEGFGDALFAEQPRRSMLEATEPPSCLAGGVTAREDVAPPLRRHPPSPLRGGTCGGPPCTCGAGEPVVAAVAGEGGAS